MARIAIATLQPVFDCRWSRHEPHAPAATSPETSWVCVREGAPRILHADECATCPHWELATSPAYLADAALSGTLPDARTTAARLITAGTWLLVLISAVTLLAVGLSILSSPLMIPIAVGLWLSAAAVLGFAFSGGLPGA